MTTKSQYHTFMDYPENVESLPGVLVPQQVYPQPPGQQDVSLLPSLRFFMNGQPGLHLQTARDVPLHAILDNAAEPCMLSTTNNTATLRILWPGYDGWQLANGLHAGYQHVQRTRAQVATQVASRIMEFYQDMASAPCKDTDWRLDNSPYDSLYLVELRNVARGSWQPVLCRRID